MQLLTPILVLAITGVSMYFILFKLDIFYISDIQVIGAKTFVSSTDIFELAKTRSYGKNIFTYSTEDLQNSLRKDFQGAKEIYVHKQFPDKVSIFVIERVPVAVMTTKKSNENFVVDEDGYVLGIVDPQKTNLPRILYNGDISVGYFLNKESLAVYFDVLKSSDAERLKASSMSLHSDYISMYVDDTVEVLIGKDKDIPKAIKVISSILTQLKTEGKNVKKIDLRFEKVIVSYR
jgi:cell division septal protein FtsQ